MEKQMQFIRRHKLVSNGRYMATPMFLHVELTQRCPVGCPQCYIEENALDFKWDDLERRILEASEWGIERILLTGGEPLIYPHLHKVLQLLGQLQMQYTISTSGYALTLEKIRWLKATGVFRVYLSINGSIEAIHNLSRNRFYDAITALEKLGEAEISTGINWVARADNLMDLRNMIKLGEKYHIDEFVVLGNKPDLNGKIQSAMSIEQIISLAGIIDEINQEKRLISIDPCFSQLNKYMSRYGEKTNTIFHCSGGKTFLDLLANNKITCCRHLDRSMDIEVSGTPMATYWNDSALDKIRLRDVTCGKN